MWHCSDREIIDPKFSAERTLCLSDDRNVAMMYLRGAVGQTHYLYRGEWDSASIATEAELSGIVENLGLSLEGNFDGQPYLAMKKMKVRQAVLDAGYDGVEYEDTHEGCNYQTIELLRRPEGFRLVMEGEVDGN